jgi:hypothetical protein
MIELLRLLKFLCVLRGSCHYDRLGVSRTEWLQHVYKAEAILPSYGRCGAKMVGFSYQDRQRAVAAGS